MPTLRRLLAPIAALALSATARADLSVLSTYPSNPADIVSGSAGDTYGQAFQAGTQQLSSLNVRLQLDAAYSAASPPTDLRLVLDNANPDGTIGSTFYDGFKASTIDASGQVLFTAGPAYTLAAGQVYWLVLDDPGGPDVLWQYSSDADSYESNYGYSAPINNSSYYSGGGSSGYYDLSSGSGPQVFDLEAAAGVVSVDAPPAAVSLATGMLSLIGVAGWSRRRRDRPRPGPARAGVRSSASRADPAGAGRGRPASG